MKISRELNATTIRQVSAAGVRIGDVVYTGTLALSADTVYADWSDKPVAALEPGDFGALIEQEPDVILLGTGPRLQFAPREVVFSFAKRGIGFEVMDTAAAARTFNVLAGEGRNVVAVLYAG